MSDNEAPIAWTALPTGTTVRSSDGEEVGTVARVVADVQKDIFSGLAVSHGLLSRNVFVPATAVEEITRDEVRLSISSGDVEALEDYEG